MWRVAGVDQPESPDRLGSRQRASGGRDKNGDGVGDDEG